MNAVLSNIIDPIMKPLPGKEQEQRLARTSAKGASRAVLTSLLYNNSQKSLSLLQNRITFFIESLHRRYLSPSRYFFSYPVFWCKICYTGVRVTPSNLFVCFLTSSKFFVFWKSLSIEPYAFFEDAFDKRSALFLFGYEIYFFYLVPRTNRLNKFLISCFLKIYIDWNACFFTILSKTDRRRPDYWQQ